MDNEDKPTKNRLHTKHDPNLRNEVIGMCWEYLQMNFHKFTEQNKIMIATKLCSKEVQGPLVDNSQHRETYITINKTYKGAENPSTNRVYSDGKTNASV